MNCPRLSAFLHSVARRLESKPDAAAANIEFVAALKREAGRSMGDEVNKMLAERDAELRDEIAEARGRRPTRFVRKLRTVK